MRLRNLALTVLFGLGVCGFVSAEESGNWFTRMFTRSSEKVEPTKEDAAKSAPKSTAPDERIVKAKTDLERRQEVCLKLLEIADASGDDDLRRKALALDSRALDAYKAAVGARTRQEPIGTVNMNDVRAAEKNAKGGR